VQLVHRLLLVSLLGAPPGASPRPGDGALPVVTDVEVQPLVVQVRRLTQSLELLGSPLPDSVRAELDAAARLKDPPAAIRRIQAALDPLCLYGVDINPESRVKVAAGPAEPVLDERGWRQFLVKVHNQAGVTARLRVASPNASPGKEALQPEAADRWLELRLFEGRPLEPTLSGLELEYRILQISSRDAGKRAAVIAFDVGQGTQDLGFRNDLMTTFECRPATAVTLRVLDERGAPTTAGFEVRDGTGRIYPSRAQRTAPDMTFQAQVYRSDGDQLGLPAGEYSVLCTRGPEYLRLSRTIRVGAEPSTETFELERWIDPSESGYWSGDHHIHAAGCAHFSNPGQGIRPPDVFVQCLGEDVKVGCNLTWGPCFDYQKTFFTGAVDKVSTYPYLLRYDIEVSGFGSGRSGHLCLLRLKDQIPPGGDSKDHWPTLGLNTLRWAKAQGAVVGSAHSGWGLSVPTTELPNYVVPPYESVGANEYIVDVTHEVPGPDGELVPAVDFMGTVDTPYVWELNMWYHTLNCGFRTRIAGETDFPCIYGERVGMGRSYVKLEGKLEFDAWCEGLRRGAGYVSEGRSHLMDFQVGGQAMGAGDSELRLAAPGRVTVTLAAAALLPEEVDRDVLEYETAFEAPDSTGSWDVAALRPFWHLERARVGDTRRVPVEVVVNGRPVASRDIEADGSRNELSFDVALERSSWVAARVLGSSHTNPVFVVVGGAPIRASRRSAQWCLEGVDRCWDQKRRFYAEGEMAEALAAYEHARATYRRILRECEVD